MYFYVLQIEMLYLWAINLLYFMRKILLIISIILLYADDIFAQKTDTTEGKSFSNYIKLSHGGVYIPKNFPLYRPYFKWGMTFSYLSTDLANARKYQYMTIGANYERRVYRNWFLGVGYMQWKDLFHVAYTDRFIINVEKQKIPEVGDLQYRLNYKMADAYALYKWKVYRNDRHFINIGIGASYCWGHNELVSAYWINWEPPRDEVTYLVAEEIKYWGIIPSVGYDFLFARRRLNIGPDIRARFYSGRSPAEYNINLHFGVNF